MSLISEWKLLIRPLPRNWRALAFRTGALVRARSVPDPDSLLRLLLLHASGLSLHETCARAPFLGLPSLTASALHQRLIQVEPWLRALNGHLLADLHHPIPGRHVVRLVDATTVQRPGSEGTDWRVHFVLRLPELTCDFFEVTDESGGETYKRIPVLPGDVLMGDRGYGHRAGAAWVLSQQGDVVVRINTSHFPLLDQDGSQVEFLPLLRTVVDHEPGEWAVQFDHQKQRHPARLCAVRNSEAATERAHKRLRKQAQKRERPLSAEALEAAGYTMVLTTLSADTLSAKEVLELYRTRWQIELSFKRLKSLMGLDELPKQTDPSCQSWLQAKLLLVLLTERLIRAAPFSPWGFRLEPREPMARVHRGA